MKLTLKISSVLLWTALYFCCMLFYTFIDIVVWEKLFPKFADWLDVLTIAACTAVFIFALKKRSNYSITIFKNINGINILLALGCSLFFFLLLDNFLDPLFESLLPNSEDNYKQIVQALLKSPITSFLQVCILAPIIEEILMRGLVLEGLKNMYGVFTALLFSSLLFAILHFNMVQTLSALVCGIVLGLLYLKTNSIFCCILAHIGYNLISFFVLIKCH